MIGISVGSRNRKQLQGGVHAYPTTFPPFISDKNIDQTVKATRDAIVHGFTLPYYHSDFTYYIITFAVRGIHLDNMLQRKGRV